MSTTKRLIAILLYVLVCAFIAHAQDGRQEPQAGRPISQDVTIIIGQKQVRLTAQKAVEEMRLQVFDQSGVLVYDSGVITGSELNWPLQNGNGEAVKSGLYVYTLSVKDAGATDPCVRRGHFIVDRAGDRQTNADRLWITSQSENGVGAELTVACNEENTVAGAVIAGERRVEAERGGIKREAGNRAIEGETRTDKPDVLAVNGTGTPGRVAKFTGPEQIGDSTITTDNFGNVGIGVSSPQQKLHVDGNEILSTGGGAGFKFRDRGSASGADDWVWYSSGNLARFWRANVGDLISVTPNGNVGIGTPSPPTKLSIDQGDVTVAGRIRLGVNLIQASFAGDPGPGGIAATGNVLVIGRLGVGTSSPELPFQLAGFNIQEANVRSFNERAILSLDSNINGQRRVWTLENGIYGEAGKFAVYDRTANRARLTIDPSGITGVDTLQIRGGSDFSESFDISDARNSMAATMQVEPGMVVSIDPDNPGKLVISNRAYDRRVAGIISGAGGVRPGLMMSQEGSMADGKHPVALTGRVYCWGDASHGAIEPGDLLTPSDIPGYAMKVTDHIKAQGAVIGKAMTGLKHGKGLVLVLVTLQ